MNTIQRKPIVKAKVYQKRIDSTNLDAAVSANVIDDISVLDLLALQPNPSVSTFDGFFGERPEHPSLTYELCNEYAELFIITSQYLWGPRSTASILQTIKELMSLREFEDVIIDDKNKQNQSNSENQKEDEDEREESDSKNKKQSIKKTRKMKQSPWTLALQKAGESLCKELENREIIHNNMLIGNLSGMP